MISVKLIDLNQKDFKLRAVLNKRVIGFLKLNLREIIQVF